MNLLKKGAVALTLIFASSLIYSQEYKPLIKVSKGQEYNYLMDMTMEMTQSMGGQEMKYGSTGNATIKNAISDVLPDGKIEVITSNWDAKVTTKIMKDTTMTFNGKVGSSTKFTMDKLGNTISKTIIDADQNNSKVPGLDNMTNSPAFCEFPETTLKPGDKWNKERNDSVAAGPMGKLDFKVKSEYTFGGKETIEGKILYKLTVSSNIQISGKGNMQGMDIAIDGTGVVTGVLYFDPANGVVQTNKTNMELDMSVAVSGQQSMTIPMTQKMTMTYKLIK